MNAGGGRDGWETASDCLTGGRKEREGRRVGGTPAERTNTGPPGRSHRHGNVQVSLAPLRQGGRTSERANYHSLFELSSM